MLDEGDEHHELRERVSARAHEPLARSSELEGSKRGASERHD